MNRAERRKHQAWLIDKYGVGDTMQRVDRTVMRDVAADPLRVWMSVDFLAALYMEGRDVYRLSVNRTGQGPDGRWLDGITWDDLMRVKSECGFGDRWAVECFPPDGQVVNVANIRHLWLLDGPPTFGWTR